MSFRRLGAAKKGGYWSYMAGTVAVMLTAAGEVTKASQPELGGLKLLNHRTTLPQRKGLSSSAAACVLVVRAFSTVYGLGLSAADEMELAFRGEALTPSACGRMDQVCALGQVLTLMVSSPTSHPPVYPFERVRLMNFRVSGVQCWVCLVPDAEGRVTSVLCHCRLGGRQGHCDDLA